MRIKIKSKKLLSLLLCFTMLLGAGSVMASAEAPVVDMTEGLKALTETTTLPANLKGAVGDEDILYRNPNGYDVYADLYKFEVTASHAMLTVSEKNDISNFDIYYWLFEENGDAIDIVYNTDDNYGFSYCVEETGTYYLAVAGWRDYCAGDYDISVSLTEVTGEIYDVEEALLAVTETTALPAEFDYELGSEDIRYYDGHTYTYGKLIKIEVKEDNTLLKVRFKGDSKKTETYVYVYKLETDGENYYLNETITGSGFASAIVDSGTYCIALLGYDFDDEGNCHANISAEKAVIKNMTDALAELTETTSLPAEFDYELGSGNILYITPEDDMVYAKLIKFTVDKGNTVLTSYFGGKDDYVDTYTWLFKQNDDNTVIEITDTDSSNLNYTIAEPGTYYLALAGYASFCVGECTAEINTYSLDDAESLDFTDSENLPVPGADDKWSWDETTKTLTLKDGFSFLGYTESSYAAITLPDGSTVFVEGRADIKMISDSSAIGSKGKLTVKGSDAETSKLSVEAQISNSSAILAEDVTVEDVEINTRKTAESIKAINSVIIKNAKIGLSDCQIGINTFPNYSEPNISEIIIENSKIDITAFQAAIATFKGNITVTDSELNIETEGIGIDAEARGAEARGAEGEEETTETAGKIAISGGTLKIATESCCLTGIISLSDVDFDLRSNGGTFYYFGSGVVDLASEEGFSLPGVFTLYDIDGNELYNGEWSDEIQIIDGELYVGEEKVISAVTFHPTTPDDPAEPDDEDEINCPFFRWLKAFILSCIKWIKEMPVSVFFWFKGVFENLASVL